MHARYREWPAGAQDLRPRTTARLEGRPVFGRTAPRTRAPVWVTMVAVTVGRQRRRALVAAFGTTDDDRMAVTVDDALAACSRLCWRSDQGRGPTLSGLPAPQARQAALLNAFGTPGPDSRSGRLMSADGRARGLGTLICRLRQV